MSSVLNFNLDVEALFGGLSPQKPPVWTELNFEPPVSLGGKLADICLIRVIAYSG